MWDMYYFEISNDDQSFVMNDICKTKGDIPLRHLGFPSFSNKLSYTKCKPLIIKIAQMVHNWSFKVQTFPTRLR